MEQPVKFKVWLYQNHGYTSHKQLRNKEKYFRAYEMYCKNLQEVNMSDYERELDAWQTKFEPITLTALIVLFMLAMKFIDS